MSVADIRQKINVVESALKDAGAENAINAIIEVLKEIATTLENQQVIVDGSPRQSSGSSSVPLEGGRKIKL